LVLVYTSGISSLEAISSEDVRSKSYVTEYNSFFTIEEVSQRPDYIIETVPGYTLATLAALFKAMITFPGSSRL
jgi:hypothetical protein